MATYSINVDVNSKSVNQLEQDLQALEAQFKTLKIGDPGFVELGNKIKGVKTQLKDIELQFEGLDKEQRATKLVDAFNGLTGAVGAVSSAFLAFGVESEAIENAEKKLLGVIGVVSGLRDVTTGLVATQQLLGPTFKSVGNAITEAFTTGTVAARAFNVALAGLGIGAVILAVNAWTNAINKNKKAQEDAATEIDKEFARGDAAARKKLNNIITNNKKILRDELENARKLGKSDSELADIRLKNQKKLSKELDDLRENSVMVTGGFIDQLLKTIDEAADKEIEIQYEKNEILRREGEKANEVNKQLRANERKAIEDYNASIRELQLANTITDEARIKKTYENRLADLKAALTEELAQENLTAAASQAIKNKYATLEKLALVTQNQQLEALRQAALDKQITQTEEAITQISTYTQRQVAELDFFYDEILSKFQKLTPNEFLEIIKKSDPKKFFSDTIDEIKKKYEELKKSEDELAISTVDNITKSAEIAKQKVRQRALDEIVILEEGQKEQIKLYDREIELVREKFSKQKELAKKNGEDLKPIIDAEAAAVNDVEKKKQADFTQTQITKKQIAEKAAKDEVEITKRTAEEIQKIQFAQGQLAVQYAQSFTNSLQTFSEARANNEINGIQKQIDAEVSLAKARGATQEEIEKITTAGQARLDQANEEAFNKQKKFAIAQALLDGTSAVLRIFANAAANPKSILFPAQPYVEAAIAAVFTAAKVAQISSTSYSGGGGGGAAGGVGANSIGYNSSGGQILNPFGTPGGGTNILPPRLAPPSGGGVGGSQQVKAGFGGEQVPVVRAYVLAGDVTEAVDAEAKLNQKRAL